MYYNLTETRQKCAVHLINEGVVVENGLVSITVQVTGPSSANRLSSQFECRVDSNRYHNYMPCKLCIHMYLLAIL